jgi:prolyl oligopeptidase
MISNSPTGEPVREVLHGIEVEDPFRWLEDQDSPATRAFIRREQAAYREYLSKHSELRGSIEARVRELLTVETVDLPIPDRRGGLLYLKRRADEEQKAIYHRDEWGGETLLLSSEILGRNPHTSLAILQISPDGQYLVFALRTGGEDVQEVGIYDLEQRRMLPDRLPRGFYRGLVFDPSGAGFYYVHEETEARYQIRRSVRRHLFEDDHHADTEVFYGGDGPSLRLVLQISDEGSSLGYTIVSLESEPRTRFLIHRLPTAQPPETIVELGGAGFGARFHHGALEAQTTFAAPLGRIVAISPERPDPTEWVDIVPEQRERLRGYERSNDAIIAHYLDGSATITRVYSGSGDLLRKIHYPREGTVSLGSVDAAHDRLFYAYSDITTPPAIHAVALTSGETTRWWQQMPSRGSVELELESRTFASRDGVAIPITLVHPKGNEAPRPVLLSAYGGGGVSNTPKFSVLLTVLFEAGVSCAIAHVRGGGEGGLEWHLAAQKQHKQTSVDDLVAAADWLVENHYTVPEYLGLAGQSNGALLTLCAITQRPKLFRAAMALGPLADLTRFHLFGVARGFVAELGSPDNPDEFPALLKLSPYHHIQPGTHYPAVLIISGDLDKRCDSLHSRKMIARLREAACGEHLFLLDYDEYRGHKPVLALTERIRSLTNRLTFLIAELGDSLFPEVPA